jgi:hypothetical protein
MQASKDHRHTSNPCKLIVLFITYSSLVETRHETMGPVRRQGPMFASMEKDAAERFARRQAEQRRADALKEQGNARFKVRRTENSRYGN